MAGQGGTRARKRVEGAIVAESRDPCARLIARSKLQLPPDLDLGKIGRAVLLELASDEREDSRVRVVAARELLVLGVAAEERERLRAIEQSSAITQMTDAELEALAGKPE